MPSIVKSRNSKFVFAHLISPHPPYIFGANGEKVFSNQSGQSSRLLFINQLEYINKKILLMLNSIFEIDNGREKIIIIQGDHGIREIIPNNIYNFKQDWANETFGTLNAIYISDKEKLKDVHYYTPVNTFRIVLSQWFNQNLTLLENKFYFTDFKSPIKLCRVIE
jgi:hypothetical protein